ncbi:MAG TPA: acyltransferase [Edaphobacter sp.]|uniref:acyltransferase family protein n=1 Tax=Edaphobacter sp. TaxID=1934404 RepID=UPI002B94F81D|nr:acyltransferase [Edaphobacter sp.]HUZ95819.1 acyltransferase [Edaphobacter sp.]
MDTAQVLHEGLVPSPGKRIRRRGLHALTGIRFFAAFWVMAYHFGAGFTARAHLPRPVTVFLENGHLGVALFFMLSGFILYYTYHDNLQSLGDLYKFFVARFARLYPVYLLAIVIAAFLYMRLPHGKELLIFPLLQSWVPPVSNNGGMWITQAWTLSVEAFFYCCFPLLLLPFRHTRSAFTFWLLAALSGVLIVALQIPMLRPGFPATWLTRHVILPVLCLPEFVFGLALGAIFLRRQTIEPRVATNDWITAAGILPCFAILAAGAGDYLISLTTVVCFGWAIYRLADGRGWLTNVLSSKVFLLLGGASFALYILQGPVRIIAHRLFANFRPGLDAALSPFILISLSCLIFLFYEEPLRDIIRKFLTRPQKA